MVYVQRIHVIVHGIQPWFQQILLRFCSGRLYDSLHGLDSRLSAETGMPIIVAKNPLHSVAIGGGQCLEEFEALKGVLISSSHR